jgi:hypothetical protein
MSHPKDAHFMFIVVDLVEDSVLSNPKPVVVRRADDLPRPWRSWFVGQGPDLLDCPVKRLRR